jgi:chromate transport protein ChrA
MWGEMSKLEVVSVVLCFTAGLVMLFDGLLWVGQYSFLRWVWGDTLGLGDFVEGIIKIVLALVVLVGAWFTQDHGHGREVLGGVLVIVFSILGVFTGSYVYLAIMIVGIIGGALAVVGHRRKHPVETAQKK